MIKENILFAFKENNNNNDVDKDKDNNKSTSQKNLLSKTEITNSSNLFGKTNANEPLNSLFSFGNVNREDSNDNKSLNYNPFISPANVKKEKINEKNSSFSFLTSNDKLNSNKNENELNNNNNLEIKEIKRSNSKISFTEIEKCHHKKFFTSYCTKDSNNTHGFLCYECLYKYHSDHISECIPIKRKIIPKYIQHYKNCIINYGSKIKKICDRMESILKMLYTEEINDISYLFERKLNLNYELPIEIPITDRIEIAVNNKLAKHFKRVIDKESNIILNLFKSDLEALKFRRRNPNKVEKIKFESSVEFDLIGIGIPELSQLELKKVNVAIYKGTNLLDNNITFENSYENESLSIGVFKKNPIKIEANAKYTLIISNIENLEYISVYEEYNENSKIKIYSNNSKTILACLIIKDNNLM